VPYVIVEINRAAATAFGLDVSLSSSTPFSTVYNTVQVAYGKLKNLLLTRIGERPLQPEFGTDLFRILFETNSRELQQDIEEYIIPKVSQWIPEITINAIKIKTIEDDPSMLHTVEIRIEWITGELEDLNTLILAIDDGGILQITQG
jgi:phage baseplate assembly protein W